MNMVVLKGKVALITGASSGIGAATAKHFASLGCSLTLTARNEENLVKVKAECLALGLEPSQVLIIKSDVLDTDRMKHVVEETIKKFGKLDILINNAGILCSGPVETSPIEDYDKIMNVNVRSVLILTKMCIPHLKKTKGSIVNVSSIAGPCSFPNVTYYCMTKAALDQFTKCLALELALDGVRVNAVNPGVIETNIHKSGGMNEEQYKIFLEKAKSTHALGRHGTVDEVAKAVAFLASNEASFTTGQLFRIDGGRGLMTPR